MRATLVAAIAALLLIAPAVAGAAPQLLNRSCKGRIYNDKGPVGVKVARGSTTCSTAKRIFKAYFKSDAPCEGSSCVRRHSGWTCQTAGAWAAPRVASCVRGKATIEAYAIVD